MNFRSAPPTVGAPHLGTLVDILRVNHAGECGAIQIYTSQRAIARWRAPELLPFLDHALCDERSHRDEFARLMQQRRIVPCAMLALWGLGGLLLGFATGALGRSAILVCTVAVERTVHRHLTDQLVWLADRDVEVSAAIEAIRVEEIQHLEGARQQGPQATRSMVALDGAIAWATEALIWLSTYGASSRMARRVEKQ